MEEQYVYEDSNEPQMIFRDATGIPETMTDSYQQGMTIQPLVAETISPPAPAFKFDYGRTVATPGVYQDTTIIFTADLFTVAPKVIVTYFDIDGIMNNSVIPYVYDTTESQCTIRGVGTQLEDVSYDWIAVGV